LTSKSATKKPEINFETSTTIIVNGFDPAEKTKVTPDLLQLVRRSAIDDAYVIVGSEHGHLLGTQATENSTTHLKAESYCHPSSSLYWVHVALKKGKK
jgi:hypothetical protein